MDISTTAITLMATDYRENDKILLLYSPDYGKIAVTARGIRKSTAKLRYAQEPFFFGNFELAERQGRYVLKTCTQQAGFFDLREDIVRYVAGCCVCECVAKFEPEGQPDQQLFVDVAKCLAVLCDANVSAYVATVYFLIDYLRRAGYEADFAECRVCKQHTKRMYLDLQAGGVLCEQCRQPESILLSPVSLNVMQLLGGIAVDKLKNVNIPQSQLKECLGVLNKYISHTLGNLNSLSQLVKL